MVQIWLADDIARVAPDDPVQAFAWAMSLDGESVRKVERRHTFRLTIGEGEFFVKQHQGVMWKECLTDLLRLARPILGADNEFRMTRLVRAAGLLAPEPAGVGYATTLRSRQSFLITRALSRTLTLNEIAHDWWQAPPALPLRREIVRRLAESTAALHALGVNHRDLYINHFRVPTDSLAQGAPELYLMDLHRAQHRASVPKRWLVKDLGSLLFSCLDKPLRKSDVALFLKHYHNSARLNAEQLSIWRAAAKRALKMRARHVRKAGNQSGRPVGSTQPGLESWLGEWL